MAISLSNLRPPGGATTSKKRVGRGRGSDSGKTAGRGHKGAQARSGYKRRLFREGGQMPLQRRLPKRGFYNRFRVEYQPVSLEQVSGIEGVDRIDAHVLYDHRVVRTLKRPIKILGDGELTRPVTIAVDRASAAAKKKITAAGGSFEETKTC